MQTECTTYPDWPTVTAVINTCGRPAMLRRALDSVLTQSYADFELIVVYDGPADEATVRLCEEYIPRFDARKVQATLLGLDEPSGYQCAPKNAAIWAARGDYIAYLDDDNEWTPDHLAVLVDAIECGTVWPDFAYGCRTYVCDPSAPATDPNGRPLPHGDSVYHSFTDENIKRIALSPLLNFIDIGDAIIAKGALWRLHVATECMWNDQMRRFGDWELFTRGIYFAGWRGVGVDRVLHTYHWHGSNIQLTRRFNAAPQMAHVTAAR